MPTKGKIIHGLRHAVLNLRLDTLIHEVQPLVGTLRTLLSESSAPDPVLIKHCPECEFETYCRKRVTEKDDLSLLDSLSIKDRTTLNTKGIFTVTQLYPSGKHTVDGGRKASLIRDCQDYVRE